MVSELVSSLIIAVVQGLTEWLPVSSSGHLVLFEKLLDFQGGLVFDVALHFGTLMAVFVYFGGDIVDIIREVLSGRFNSENGRLGLMVLVATVPAGIVGFLMQGVFEEVFSSLWIVALGFGITGVFLLIVSIAPPARSGWKVSKPTHPPYNSPATSEYYNTNPPARPKDYHWFEFGYIKSFLVGLAQIFALFPGVSRSGATIGSGLLLGLKEKQALKFSFLMSIPIIFGANILAIGNQALPGSLIWATLVAFVVGLGAIHLLYGYILTSRKNLKWFALYTLVLALGLGIWLLL